MKYLQVVLVGYLFITSFVFGQRVAGERNAVKELILDSNSVSTIVYNYGSICKPNTLSNIADFVWKDYSLGNMFEFGPLISAEVIGENGKVLHITSDSFVLTGQGDYNKDKTEKWGWLPRAGYANPDNSEIANSANSDSWPSSWNAWHGEFGEDVAIANNELFYVMDDFSNAEFPYYPFPSDSTKRGLGVSAEVRIYQFGGFLKDAIIVKYKVKNESPKDLSKVYFGFQGDPHIGGKSDYNDDMAGYLPKDYIVKEAANTIYNYDSDGIGMGGKPTGYFSFKLLKTPNNLGLTSLHVAPYTNSEPNVPKNDPLMWQWFSADSINPNQNLLNNAGDNIIHFGTGPFQLKSGESTEIELAIFLSKDFDDMLHDAFAIQHYINWPVLNNEYNHASGNENYKIELQELPKENNGNVQISWNYTGTNTDAKVFIDYSSDGGIEWTPLIKGQSINESYTWNTKLVEDGVNYMLRVLAYNPDNPREFYYDNCNDRFTINNPEKNSKPEFKFIPFADTLRRENATIKWISEDADNSELRVIIEHSTNPTDSFQKIHEAIFSNGNNSFYWNLASIPNYEKNFLRFIIKDDKNETVYTSDEFIVNVRRGSYSTSKVQHIGGKSTANVEVLIADTSALKNNTYEVSFSIDGKTKNYEVRNLTSGNVVLDNLKLVDGMSSPTFEGLRIVIHDTEMDINYDQTHFNREALEPTYNVYFSPSNADYIGQPHVKSSLDWVVVFNDLDTNSNGSWVNIGDSTLFVPSMKTGVSPFKVIDIDNNEKANYIVDETKNSTLQNGSWDYGEGIILRPKEATGGLVSYAITFDFSSGIFPRNGDTLYIRTYNPIDSNDVFKFTADNDFILSTRDKIIEPNKFMLYQNYPNPFNPSTTISYSLPKSGLVQLKIYDMLGREIATLVNEEQTSGDYKVRLNASNLASGVYLYRIQSGSFTKSMKMILLK